MCRCKKGTCGLRDNNLAKSPTHRFGQIIGDLLEAALEPSLAKFAKEHDLYLDKKGKRPCRKKRKKCSWLDLNKNKHDLDFVLERGGTPDKQGMPAAFIETAWRSYTRHSRAKAQEIQGAVLPLVETYKAVAPFTGVVIAGWFTEGARTQLESLGFAILHFSHRSVVDAFAQFGIDAAFDEDTPDAEVQKKVDAYAALSVEQRTGIAQYLFDSNKEDVLRFMTALEKTILRQIERIIVLPLHGNTAELTTIDDAIRFIECYQEKAGKRPIQRYEIQIRYNNGDSIEATFQEKADAVAFLRTYQPVPVAEIKKKI